MASVTNPADCTLATCPIFLSPLGYAPNLAGNVFFAVWFGLLALTQVVLCVRYKTWSYMAGQLCGLVLEVIGYAALSKLHDDPFDNDQFLSYIVTITIAPAFLCYTIYLCFGRIVLVYGAHLSRISHKAYTLVFCGMDIACLLLQSAGAAWTQAKDISPADLDKALKVLKAGLGLQCASLGIFIILSLDFAIRATRQRKDWSATYAPIRIQKMFKPFLLGSFAAALLILARSAFRVQELSNGFGATSDSAETLFMVFESTMMAIAVLLLTIVHPGPLFGTSWPTTGFFQKHGQKEDDEGGNGAILLESPRSIHNK